MILYRGKKRGPNYNKAVVAAVRQRFSQKRDLQLHHNGAQPFWHTHTHVTTP